MFCRCGNCTSCAHARAWWWNMRFGEWRNEICKWRCQLSRKPHLVNCWDVERPTPRVTAKAWEYTDTQSHTQTNGRDHRERQHPPTAAPPLQKLRTYHGGSVGAALHLRRSHGGQVVRVVDGRDEHICTRRRRWRWLIYWRHYQLYV